MIRAVFVCLSMGFRQLTVEKEKLLPPDPKNGSTFIWTSHKSLEIAVHPAKRRRSLDHVVNQANNLPASLRACPTLREEREEGSFDDKVVVHHATKCHHGKTPIVQLL